MLLNITEDTNGECQFGKLNHVMLLLSKDDLIFRITDSGWPCQQYRSNTNIMKTETAVPF